VIEYLYFLKQFNAWNIFICSKTISIFDHYGIVFFPEYTLLMHLPFSLSKCIYLRVAEKQRLFLSSWAAMQL
jgi:hypothetical protein